MPWFLKGRRVACAAADPNIAGGMWAEYLVTSAQLCVPLSKQVDMEQGATMLVNPLTAWALMEEVCLVKTSCTRKINDFQRACSQVLR